jgi:hypothetical protein
MRATQITEIQGLTADSHSGLRFTANLSEVDFRDWAERHPSACLRWFSAHDLFENEPPSISDFTSKLIQGGCEIVVAYPHNYVYGNAGMRSMQDVIEEDMTAIDSAVGDGSNAYTDGTCFDAVTSLEEGEEVTFLSLVYNTVYYRSV